MDIFLVFIFIVVVFAVIAMTSEPPKDAAELAQMRLPVQGSPARITLAEAEYINRVAYLQNLNPGLALSLAERMQGDAWQIACSSLCPDLLMQTGEEPALQLLSRLDPHHRQQALNGMLNRLIEAGEEQRALDLLQHLGEELPQAPQTRIALLHASGREQEAESELLLLGEQQAEVRERLTLARLQRRLGQREAATISLERAWQQMQAEQTDALLDELIEELFQLGQFERVQQMAEQLPAEQHAPLISALTKAGLFEQANKLIAGLTPFAQKQAREGLLDAMLERNQLRLAEELLDACEDSTRYPLLLHWAQWLLQRNDLAGLNALIETRSASDDERVQLYLLLPHLTQTSPQQAADLLQQAERWYETLSREQQQEWHFNLLEAKLKLQSQMPPRERTSYELRRGLDAMSRLTRDEDVDSHINKLIRLARLQQSLERHEDAKAQMNEALQKLRDNADDLDKLDWELLLDNMIGGYMDLGDLEQARALHIEHQRAAPLDSGEWISSLLRHDHLELAIDSLNYFDLLQPEPPLTKLETRIEQLAEQSPERSQSLKERLLERLEQPSFWASRQPA